MAHKENDVGNKRKNKWEKGWKMMLEKRKI